MAKPATAWGIDIGQCALKALRCQRDVANPGQIVADAFDYIEYPKILTQPEADPVELVRDALKLFLSRNDVRGSKIAVSVSGQSGLARFIKLPPVETKKIPDIVRYEANQQIPFELDDVIWDYQRMAGGSEEEGFALETEVGLFAMKRDQVYQEIEPYEEVGIDVDIVQLTPLAIYNYIVFDELGDSLPEDEFDPEEPPESLVVLCVGTESTDLVITNGYRVWQRSVPLGGSHFTKALVKDLQLTYAKAEHLKRNATQAEDPKAIYQAMRPIFKDLLTEIQRSIGYFQSLDRAAKIGRVVALGNSIKLPGLKRYLSQNLGYEVKEVESLKSLSGSNVTESPAFKDNVLAFGVPYGLALQGLSAGYLTTNLVPREMVRDRIINRKKPWAVASSFLLAMGCLISFLLLWWPWYQVRVEDDDDWKLAKQKTQAVEKLANRYQEEHKKEEDLYRQSLAFGEDRISLFDRRLDYLNLCQAIYQCLPTEEDGERLAALAGVEPAEEVVAALGVETEKPKPTTERVKLWISEMRARKVPNLSTWYNNNKNSGKFKDNQSPLVIKAPEEEAAAPDAGAGVFDDELAEGANASKDKSIPAPKPQFIAHTAPSGPGYVVELSGYHFHKSDVHGTSKQFVQRTLVHNLQDRSIALPGSNGDEFRVGIDQLGISHPLVYEITESKVASPFEHDQGPDGAATLTRYRFVVQMAWSPKPLNDQAGSQIAQAGR